MENISNSTITMTALPKLAPPPQPPQPQQPPVITIPTLSADPDQVICLDLSLGAAATEPTPAPISVPAPASKTMLSYFSKLPSKAVVVEESNPRKLAPAFNRQHVEKFQHRLKQFDAELFYINNNNNGHSILNVDDKDKQQNNTNDAMEIDGPQHQQDKSTSVESYIASIKTKQHVPFRLKKKPRGPLRARLLQFHEDVRPPYYGTWQRKSSKIKGRRPFVEDEDIFDYEIDSEAEWDIGGPGESLKGDDSEDDEELDDYEIDMQTFVPHGYVSDDEVEVHSDQEENKSADQSLEEICDVEEDSSSIQIIGERNVKAQPVTAERQANQNQSPAQPVAAPIKQVKLEIKPITLGVYYENVGPAILSESKIQFLRTFQGMPCK